MVGGGDRPHLVSAACSALPVRKPYLSRRGSRFSKTRMTAIIDWKTVMKERDWMIILKILYENLKVIFSG